MYQSAPKLLLWNNALVRTRARITDSTKMKLAGFPEVSDPQTGEWATVSDGERGQCTTVLLVLCSLLLAPCYPSQAQPFAKPARVGVLVSSSLANSAARLRVFQQSLRDLGHVEGKNIIFEYRYAEGKPETLPALVDELIALKVDILVVDTSNAAQAAKNATQTIPVVFTIANDPVGDRQVSSLANPGGNLTGFSLLTTDLNGKRLELLKEAFSKVTRVAFLPITGDAIGEKRFHDAEIAATGLRLQLLRLSAKGADDLRSGFDAAKRAGAHALIVNPSTFANANRTRIIDLAAKYRLPAIYPSALYAEAGGLMSYGPDAVDNFRRAATYVDKILKGVKPAELPVQQPMRFEFIVNLKTVKQVGLPIPPNVLARADRVIN